MSIGFNLFGGSLQMVLAGKPYAVAKDDKHYAAVSEVIKRGGTEQEVLDILEAEKRKLTEAVSVAPDITVKGGCKVFYKDSPVGGVLEERMLTMLDEGFSLIPMSRFLANLQNNPSKRVVDQLYEFLEKGKNPLTEDGCFLAYKAVRGDFKDIHSGTFDNSIGKVIEMPRNRVDEDPDRTCSQGLHVCSFDYLPYFSHAGGHVVVCKVNPADVVAIPRDYKNTKMRVCRYEVVSEYEGYYRQEGDVLSKSSVASSSGDSLFSVEVAYDNNRSFERYSESDSLVEAAEDMNDLLVESVNFAVRVVNVATGAVVHEKDNPNFASDLDDDDFEFEDDDSEDDEGFDSDEEVYTAYACTPEGTRIRKLGEFSSVKEALFFCIEHQDGNEVHIVNNCGTVVSILK